ncbi:class I SAM-dependent methyltransferase [Geobacter hydrogenophilus]|uniref:class I SAM-dependent methyltransferase n=1 Tax=Geobacter hydrogenophilus TaxID=40983 RepID=UPI001BD964EF
MQYHLYDDRYGYVGEFDLNSCRSCGHIGLSHEFSRAELSDLYSNYYPRSSFSLDDYHKHVEVGRLRAWYEGAYRSAFRWVPRNVRVLDIGCGFGETLGYHESRGCDAYGVELDENIKRVVEKFGYKVHVGDFDCSLYEQNFFDYVTLDQVIEHLSDPIAALSGVARILKPGGMVIISTPNAAGWGAKFFGRRWINWHAPYHVNFFSRKSIRVAAARAGLDFVGGVTITSSDWLHFQWSHLFAIPPMGTPSIFWTPSADKDFTKRAALRLLEKFHQTGINHITTRFFDAVGVGDNFVFKLSKL